MLGMERTCTGACWSCCCRCEWLGRARQGLESSIPEQLSKGSTRLPAASQPPSPHTHQPKPCPLPFTPQSIPISKLAHLAELDVDTLKQQLGLLRQSTQVGCTSAGGAERARGSMHATAVHLLHLLHRAACTLLRR